MKEKKIEKTDIMYSIILALSVIIIVVNRIIVGFPSVLWLCDFASLFSILYTINMAKHNVWGFIFNIIATLLTAITCFYQQIYLNATMCVFINIPSMVIGLVSWIKNEKSGKEEQNLKGLSKKKLIMFGVFAIIAGGIFTYILYLLDGNLFYLDGIFSALCMTGVVLASKMYIEQYYFFIPANFLGIVFYTILCFQNMSNLPFVLTNVIFTIVSIMGYVNWKKLQREQNENLFKEKSSTCEIENKVEE